AGWLLVKQRQVSGLRINGESADRSCPLALEARKFADGVEVFAARVNRQEGRAGNFPGKGGVGQTAGRRVELESVDSLAHLAGVGADVGPVLRRRGFGA